jgi:hypothetical protein
VKNLLLIAGVGALGLALLRKKKKPAAQGAQGAQGVQGAQWAIAQVQYEAVSAGGTIGPDLSFNAQQRSDGSWFVMVVKNGTVVAQATVFVTGRVVIQHMRAPEAT